MPHKGDYDQSTIAAHVKELKNAGYPENQATAIALKKANKGKGMKRAVNGVMAKSNKMKIETY